MSRQLSPFQDNEFLEIGRYFQNESFSRDRKSIRLENMEIDLIKRRDGRIIVGEVKKSSKFIESAIMQLAYYIYRFREYGINIDGELLFPAEKKRIVVKLDSKTITELENAIKGIRKILKMTKPHFPKRIQWCKNCAYRDFCFC